jgi:hypothetical protein
MGTIPELKAVLNSLRKDFDVTQIQSRLEDYFRVRLEVQRINNAISNINVKTRPFEAEYAANLESFRIELRNVADSFIRKNKVLFVRYLRAFYVDYMGSTMGGGLDKSLAPEELSTKINALIGEVLKIVRSYKAKIDPTQDLKTEVDSNVIDKLIEFPQNFIQKELPETKGEDDTIAAGVQHLGDMFRTRFDAMYESNTVLFLSFHSRINQLEEDRNPLLEESSTIKTEIVQSIAELVSEAIDYLKDSTFTGTREKIREAIQTILIDWCSKLPLNGLEGNVPEDASLFIKRGMGVDAKSLGVDIENRLREEFEKYDPQLFNTLPESDRPHPKAETKTHTCNALCSTQEGRCTRRTKDEFCYQHEGEVPDKEGQKLAGIWKLSGCQTHINHSYWEAVLTLQQSGTALWKQTKGSNIWAKRTGRWNLIKGKFVLQYRAPKSGLVEWNALGIKPDAKQMGGEYRTPQISAQGVGWGGTWNGQKGV